MRYKARTNEVDLETVGGRIIAKRKEMGMTQKELAELIHVHERSMLSYELNDVIPYRKIQDIADVLNVSPAWLLHGEKAREEPAEILPVLREILETLRGMSKTCMA